MAKDPAFLFYSSDFLTGTTFLSFEDKGKYITILCQMHQHGRLSEESICFAVGLVSVSLKAKFKVDESGLWYNERLEMETEKRNKYTESRRNNGSLGGRGHIKDKKQSKSVPKKKKATAKHMVNHMENENENINDNKVIDINANSNCEKSILPFDTPAFSEAWKNWMSYRSEMGYPYKSIRSEQTALKSLSHFDEDFSIELIERSISNQWQGLIFEKTKQDFLNRKKINGSTSKFDKSQQITDHNNDQLRRIMDGSL
jgi:uncharacterized protein YdaU (DUF1376 family)